MYKGSSARRDGYEYKRVSGIQRCAQREDHEQEKFTALNDDLKQRTLDAMNTVILTMPVMIALTQI